ncbi:hypothetical protein N752_03975 [Desulforamulus aquiferis]|nr:hypothetical protein [Desulforamulus aquiferis]RYD06491.1 hypothetical protein N752_03975 [Desulforamulus aquiferis]
MADLNQVVPEKDKPDVLNLIKTIGVFHGRLFDELSPMPDPFIVLWPKGM